MALTADVKAELVRVNPGRNSVRAAELTTLLRFAGGLRTIANRLAIEAEVDSPDIARRVQRDLAELYGVRSEAGAIPGGGNRAATGYLVRVVEGGETLARQTGLLDQRGRPVRGLPNRLTTGSKDELAALWRGAFLAQGVLTDPGRSAALEVACPGNEAAMALVGAAGRLGVSAKAREVRATANRLVNFDDANLRRSAQAAVAACARVERALEILGDEVPDHLLYAGQLRLNHRDASLDELGHHADPPMTKDAVAGRIRRLLAMADKAAADRGIPNTDVDIPVDFA